MDVSLQAHRPLSCRTVFQDSRSILKLKPLTGFCPNGRYSSWFKGDLTSGASCKITASSADFSRRRQKKVSGSRPNGPGTKAIVPKTPVETSIPKTNQRNTADKKGFASSTASVVGPKVDEKRIDETSRKVEESSSPATTGRSFQEVENGSLDKGIDIDKKFSDEASLKLKLEMEEKQRIEEIERLAEENFSRGKKLFIYPQVVKPDQHIEVFLNKSLSTLNSEDDVFITGAFNEWRWKSFTFRLSRTNLKGDWWSCQFHVPAEAYKIDFVFFNGKDVYDNNDKKDFCIDVESGMDAFAFEDFLLEEKRKELEKLAEEQAERERQAEEQRRIEAEKAAQEADRAEAKAETERRRKLVQELTKKAVRSVPDVWYIEPSEFKGKDLVRLYYNRSSGPLAGANELWVHGGHNGWSAGLSIVESLVRSEEKDGDWWYAKVVVPDQAVVLDWVFADGPPQNATVYDNNHRHNFHAVVPKSIPQEQYWVEEEHQIYRKLQEERRLREEATRAKAKKTALMKAKMKERTLRRLLALGLMEYNTDWQAIQQRFLPCKSKHQIFVRQKNRCSSKAPENSIKLHAGSSEDENLTFDRRRDILYSGGTEGL